MKDIKARIFRKRDWFIKANISPSEARALDYAICLFKDEMRKWEEKSGGVSTYNSNTLNEIHGWLLGEIRDGKL